MEAASGMPENTPENIKQAYEQRYRSKLIETAMSDEGLDVNESTVIWDFEDWANGERLNEAIQIYPDWKEDDFKAMLQLMKMKKEEIRKSLHEMLQAEGVDPETVQRKRDEYDQAGEKLGTFRKEFMAGLGMKRDEESDTWVKTKRERTEPGDGSTEDVQRVFDGRYKSVVFADELNYITSGGDSYIASDLEADFQKWSRGEDLDRAAELFPKWVAKDDDSLKVIEGNLFAKMVKAFEVATAQAKEDIQHAGREKQLDFQERTNAQMELSKIRQKQKAVTKHLSRVASISE
jgi:hypothetical protein